MRGSKKMIPLMINDGPVRDDTRWRYRRRYPMVMNLLEMILGEGIEYDTWW